METANNLHDSIKTKKHAIKALALLLCFHRYLMFAIIYILSRFIKSCHIQLWFCLFPFVTMTFKTL